MVRLLRIVVLALGLVVATAAPAAADAAEPSDFRSEVTDIVPATDGVEARIRGGDAFLELSVDGDVTVIVEGYEGEPYLRFLPDGTVERNRLSSATYLNDDRAAGGTIPAEAQEAEPDTPPEWERVASGGTYAWHDHRTHWMDEASPQVDRGSSAGGDYDPWRVPLVVEGARAEVQGTLVYEDAISPLPYLALGLLAFGLVAFVLPRADPRLDFALLAGLAALALLVGGAELRETPDGGGNPLLWVLPVVALGAALFALVRGRRPSGAIAALAAVAALVGWALLRIQVLLKPVLPTSLPYALDRVTVSLALGVGLAVAFRVVTGGALALPELDDDEPAKPAGTDTD